MSIADKLLYLNETKTALREALNAAGANITTDTTFRDYAAWVDYVAWLQSGGPLNLFANGEQGAWYDPSDLSTLFQDAAGTTPVTADGDPVGLMLDKSGNGNHATQPVSADRPIYRTDGMLHWLEFNGTNHCLTTAAIDFTGTNQKTAMLAVDKRGADGVFRTAIETSFNINNQRGILLSAPSGDPSANYRVRVNAGGAAENISSPSGAFSGQTRNVISGIHAPGVVGTQLRVDGSIVASGLAAGNDGAFENHRMGIGARAGSSNHFLGDIFGIVVVGDYANEDAVYAAENYLAKLAGVTL